MFKKKLRKPVIGGGGEWNAAHRWCNLSVKHQDTSEKAQRNCTASFNCSVFESQSSKPKKWILQGACRISVTMPWKNRRLYQHAPNWELTGLHLDTLLQKWDLSWFSRTWLHHLLWIKGILLSHIAVTVSNQLGSSTSTNVRSTYTSILAHTSSKDIQELIES